MLSLRTLICQAYLAQYPTEVQTNPLEEPFFDSFGFLGSSQSFQYRNSNRSLRGKKKKSVSNYFNDRCRGEENDMEQEGNGVKKAEGRLQEMS